VSQEYPDPPRAATGARIVSKRVADTSSNIAPNLAASSDGKYLNWRLPGRRPDPSPDRR